MRTGLVLEGGAMRGLFSAGVMDVMMENGIRFDGVMGVSAGAAFGCNIKSHQPGRVIRYNVWFCKDKQYCSIWSLLRTGDLFGADYCYRVVPRQLDVFDVDTFQRDPGEFWVVCTDVETGEAIYQRLDQADDRDMEYIRASASMPLVSRVVEMDGHKMLDGGIADSIPLKAFEQRGYQRNVVILTQPEGFVKQPSKGMGLLRLALRKYPKVVEKLADRHIRYNEDVAYVRSRERDGAALVICPDEKLDIGRVEHDPQKMRAVYELGRKAGERGLKDVQAFVNESAKPVQIRKVDRGSELAAQLAAFIADFSWTEVKEHVLKLVQDWQFEDWETPFTAIADGKIVGMATLMKTDYYPLPEICPWVSTLFVSEAYRGGRISQKLIDSANAYARTIGFDRTYIPTDHVGLYEKYGYHYVRDIVNYGGGTDRLYVKEM
ncbi:MAG: GNAT family N-acetyltransferase [Clostridia bacterium]|nr:GNAT family N-acetyltransferase [Clostridia bacterium]